ncbi:hypothetical protein EDD16DRAFT_1521069 [Pisolithus croceorrhizus]|nr:hypothetical protein EDD16DRAFT_1521069 [Pisolithus croceorrhizus]
MTQWSIRSTRNRVCSFVVANKEPREATDRLRNPLALTDSPVSSYVAGMVIWLSASKTAWIRFVIIVHRIVNADPEVARSKGVPMPATTGGIKKGDDALPDILGSRIAQRFIFQFSDARSSRWPWKPIQGVIRTVAVRIEMLTKPAVSRDGPAMAGSARSDVLEQLYVVNCSPRDALKIPPALLTSTGVQQHGQSAMHPEDQIIIGIASQFYPLRGPTACVTAIQVIVAGRKVTLLVAPDIGAENCQEAVGGNVLDMLENYIRNLGRNAYLAGVLYFHDTDRIHASRLNINSFVEICEGLAPHSPVVLVVAVAITECVRRTNTHKLHGRGKPGDRHNTVGKVQPATHQIQGDTNAFRRNARTTHPTRMTGEGQRDNNREFGRLHQNGPSTRAWRSGETPGSARMQFEGHSVGNEEIAIDQAAMGSGDPCW